MTAMAYSQSKTLTTLGTPTTFEITSTPVTCGSNTYQSLSLINYTGDPITVSFDAEFYWSNNPNTPSTGDEVYTFTLGPNGTLSGDCVNTQLMKWMSGPISKTTLINIVITNLIITKS
jgi:hypothetical protein